MRSISLPPFSPVMTIMTRAVFKASKCLIRDFYEVENLQVSHKGPKDFVTNADITSEKILISELSAMHPDYGFITEESGFIGSKDLTCRWIIDPIDGTMNFMHGFPFWCISLALEKNGEIVSGLIFDPVRNELFWAEKGTGAFLNDRRIRINNRKGLEDSLLAIGKIGKDEYEMVKSKVASIRNIGSTALTLAYVACGRFDSYVATNALNYWDIAAGCLIIKEAGGSVTNLQGKQITASTESFVTANIDLREKIISLLS